MFIDDDNVHITGDVAIVETIDENNDNDDVCAEMLVSRRNRHQDCTMSNGDDVLDLFCTDDDYNVTTDNNNGNASIIEKHESDAKGDDDDDNNDGVIIKASMDNAEENDNDDDDGDKDDDEAEEDDDDDDDGINIIIQNNSMSDNYDQYMNDIIHEDLELNVEIKKLINENAQQHQQLNYSDRPVITLYAQETTIPISVDTVISSRLSDHVWGTEHPYKQFVLKNKDCFNVMLRKYHHAMNESNELSDGDEYVAFFATIYENMQKNNSIMDQRAVMTSSSIQNRFKNLHFFNKFAVIVLRQGKFVDAAVHGHYSSITHVLKRYNPTRIYCVGSELDTIDAFLKFKHQPFYGELGGTRVRYIGRSLIHNRTSVMFCPLNLRFCAFCRAIDTILTYYTNLRQHRLIPTVISNMYQMGQQQQQQRRQRRQQRRPKDSGKLTFRPRLRQLIECFKIPHCIPYRVLNYKSRMNCIKHKRLSHRARRSSYSTNSYVIGTQ